MPREPLPDVLHVWPIPWVKQGDVWVGPRVGGPDDRMLQEALHFQRIEIQDGVCVMSNPWLPLDRFTWHEGDVEISGLPEEDADG